MLFRSPSLARVLRGDVVVGEAELIGLKRGAVEAKEVIEGEIYRIHLSTNSKLELLEDDKIEFFSRETVSRKL